ncbi:MAG: glycosyltransferase family 39 protein [Chloroflexi bacterium]|nr:glycosyltransferase family 39 protein [Chloroflexota bacterium]
MVRWSLLARSTVYSPRAPNAARAGALPAARDRVQAAFLREVALLVVIVGVALAIRATAMQRGLGFDELFTALNFVGAESAWKTASTSINFNNHVGYSLLARLSEQTLGRAEWALRLPALLLGLATLPALWWYARPLVGPRLALAATLALALAPEHIRWSTTARGYTALLLGAVLTSGLLFRLVLRPSARTALVYFGVTVLAVYCHLYMVAVSVVQGLLLVTWLLVYRRERARWPGALVGLGTLIGAAGLTLLLYLPILISLVTEARHSGRGTLNLWFAWYTAVELLSLPTAGLLVAVLALAGLGLMVIGRGRRPLGAWAAGYAAALIGLPLLAATLARPADLYPRFFIFSVPILLVAIGVGLRCAAAWLAGRLPSAMQPLAWAPAVACLLLVGINWYALYPAAMTDEGFRAAIVAQRSAVAGASAPCAFGAGAELFQWYSHEPLVIPKTVDELRRAYRGRGAPVCIYRPVSWEGRGAAEIREYLTARSTVTRYGEILLFRARPGANP